MVEIDIDGHMDVWDATTTTSIDMVVVGFENELGEIWYWKRGNFFENLGFLLIFSPNVKWVLNLTRSWNHRQTDGQIDLKELTNSNTDS